MIKRKFGLVMLLAIVFVGFYSCKSKKAAVENAGYNFNVNTGEQFRIELAANPSTGYSWKYAKEPDTTVVQFVEKEVVERPDSVNRMVGAGYTEVWVFKGVDEGETSIDLKFARAQEPVDSTMQKSYSVRVKSK